MSDEVNPFSVLPEGCIANIISLTSPKDACRAASVSLGFKSAADSDTVWERFLPPNYGEIVARASPPLAFSTKKQLYLLLHASKLLLDGGKLIFWLNERGEKGYMMSARSLEIASVDNPQHWEWTSVPNSRFSEVAKLRSVSKLEIRGTMPARMLSPNTKYVAWLMYMPYRRFRGLDCPSWASVKFVKEDGSEKVGETTKVYIDSPSIDVMFAETERQSQFSWALNNDWYGLELAEFFIGEGASYDVHIQVSETQNLNLKEGLILDGISLAPKDDSEFSKLSVLRD